MEIVVPTEFRPLWEITEVRPIIKYPAEMLRKVCAPVQRVNKGTRQLIERMRKVMTDAHGIGLAAPQLGIDQRICLVTLSGKKEPTALINPEVIFSDGSAIGEEGCLSLPGLYGDVVRPSIVEVSTLTPEGSKVKLRLEGMNARVAQHEIDHLNGVLFIDKVDLETLHWSWPLGATAE